MSQPTMSQSQRSDYLEPLENPQSSSQWSMELVADARIPSPSPNTQSQEFHVDYQGSSQVSSQFGDESSSQTIVTPSSQTIVSYQFIDDFGSSQASSQLTSQPSSQSIVLSSHQPIDNLASQPSSQFSDQISGQFLSQPILPSHEAILLSNSQPPVPPRHPVAATTMLRPDNADPPNVQQEKNASQNLEKLAETPPYARSFNLKMMLQNPLPRKWLILKIYFKWHNPNPFGQKNTARFEIVNPDGSVAARFSLEGYFGFPKAVLYLQSDEYSKDEHFDVRLRYHEGGFGGIVNPQMDGPSTSELSALEVGECWPPQQLLADAPQVLLKAYIRVTEIEQNEQNEEQVTQWTQWERERSTEEEAKWSEGQQIEIKYQTSNQQNAQTDSSA
ncbi:hypothetical protein D9758_009386 [Tetrapyrgos nigripes]|uniref:Uncharacterized protein n=1 Tax=Tetrapyrgos nigripes TaxID=182062 RepID=A0A8H5D1U9_9AGAR|nr:hypothetical protein D9758_009386 [Tetrapyrgos nigripes]